MGLPSGWATEDVERFKQGEIYKHVQEAVETAVAPPPKDCSQLGAGDVGAPKQERSTTRRNSTAGKHRLHAGN